jgi:endonuclease/exonuclease/phosphatase (EEP) superfamily protein YafD
MIVSIAISSLSFLLKKTYKGLISLLAASLILVRFFPLFTTNPNLTNHGPSLKVMTFNVHDQNQNFGGILSIIHEEDPDILALQELTPAFGVRLLGELDGRYPYHTLTSDQITQSQGLLSRYKLANISRSPDKRILSATVQTPQERTVVVNVHAPSNQWPATWSKDWIKQREFLSNIADSITNIQAPLILLGDFNITYLSENYEILKQELRDGFEDSGSGLGLTYPANGVLGIKLHWALVRIDYIFHNDYFVTLETSAIKETYGSDHRPVISILGYNWSITPNYRVD